MMTVTTRTLVTEAPRASSFSGVSRNFAASGAPKMCAFCALSSSDWLMTPTVWLFAMWLRTWYSEMKNGDCARIGRQLESGLVPVSLYSFIISSD